MKCAIRVLMMRKGQRTNLSGGEVQSVAKPLRLHGKHRVHFSFFAFHLLEIGRHKHGGERQEKERS